MTGAVIGHAGEMCSHDAAGIEHSRSILDIRSRRRIGIVTAPDLWTVVKHTAVKAPTPTGTVFQKEGRIGFCQSPLQLIDAQHVAMIHFSLSARRQRCAVYVGQTPVHIPFQILDMAGRKHLLQHLPDAVHHLCPGKVQRILVSDWNRLSPRNVQRPVRVCSVKLTLWTDGLRLHPKAKIHVKIIDLLAKAGQSFRQLFFIRHPISQTGTVIISPLKPSVVQNKEIDIRLLCRGCQLQELFLVKIKIAGFPAVDQHRARLRCIRPVQRQEVSSNSIMKLPA